mgnify:CR=1 FL=1
MLNLGLGLWKQKGGSSGSSAIPANAVYKNGQPLVRNGEYITRG